jgi:PAS domain S-box-containing protein
MAESEKTRNDLLAELAALRRRLGAQSARLAKLEQAASDQQQINDSLPVLVATAGLDGYYKEINAAFTRILGWSRGELLAQPFIEFIHPDDRAAATETFDRLQRGDTVHGFVDRNICKDGSYRSISWVVIPVPERAIVFGIGLDITGRLRAERALRESEQRFRKVFREGPIGIAVLDTELGVQHVNHRVCGMLGYSEEEIKTVGVRAITHPDDWQLEENMSKRLLRGDVSCYTIEKRYIRKSGEVFWGQLTASLLHDLEGAPAAYIGMLEDITERKQAELALQHANEHLEERIGERTRELEAANDKLGREIEERRRIEFSLRRSERRFRNYFEQGLIGMAATTLDKRWLDVNDQMCQILGYSREELMETTWSQITHPDDLADDLEQFDRMTAGETDHYRIDKRFLRKDGSTVYTTILVRPFRHDDGSIDHIVCLMQDITERKRAQEALERERRTLLHMLQASDHERQTIAYDIHDGLAQQLTAAIMQFQTCDHLAQSEPGPARRAYEAGVAMIQRAHFEARRLISGVRPPALDESGVAVAIAHLVHEQRKPQGPPIEYHDDVEFGRLPPILENAVYRIAQEALGNACQHSQSERIRVSLVQHGNRLQVEIRDWGIGFEPEKIEENRFGLEGIRERTRLLGGTCTVESRPGQGTSVRVTLPIFETA